MSATAQLLDLIISRAPLLREAGVLRVQLDGFAFELAPIAQGIGEGDDDEIHQEDEIVNPLDDPATFGGRVPGFRRREHEEHRR